MAHHIMTAQRSIVDPRSPFTFLQQRLRYVDACPERTFVNIAENVPVWPRPFTDEMLHKYDTLTYTPCEGTALLLRAVARREHAANGRSPDPDQILITSGALHGISLVVRLLARPGGIAVVQA